MPSRLVADIAVGRQVLPRLPAGSGVCGRAAEDAVRLPVVQPVVGPQDPLPETDVVAAGVRARAAQVCLIVEVVRTVAGAVHVMAAGAALDSFRHRTGWLGLLDRTPRGTRSRRIVGRQVLHHLEQLAHVQSTTRGDRIVDAGTLGPGCDQEAGTVLVRSLGDQNLASAGLTPLDPRPVDDAT